VVSARDAVEIIKRLSADGIQVWVCGGWGIDALLEKETRPHKDLDILVLLDDIVRARKLLECGGFSLKEFWSENLQAVDARGVETPTAFVLCDSAGREIDLHAIRLDAEGGATPAYEGESMVFSAEDLSGEGTIAGISVRCLSVEMQFRGHTGYELPERQIPDLELLRERFGAERAK
jgi:lincosamide nucleotidyltransferase A/C/D/E